MQIYRYRCVITIIIRPFSCCGLLLSSRIARTRSTTSNARKKTKAQIPVVEKLVHSSSSSLLSLNLVSEVVSTRCRTAIVANKTAKAISTAVSARISKRSAGSISFFQPDGSRLSYAQALSSTLACAIPASATHDVPNADSAFLAHTKPQTEHNQQYEAESSGQANHHAFLVERVWPRWRVMFCGSVADRNHRAIKSFSLLIIAAKVHGHERMIVFVETCVDSQPTLSRLLHI